MIDENFCDGVTTNGGKLCDREKGWGTGHKGMGYCKDHDVSIVKIEEPVGALDQGLSRKNSYQLIVKDDKLRSFIEEEEGRDRLDDVDGEIKLQRALIKFALSALDDTIEMDEDADGNLIFSGVGKKSRDINSLVKGLTDTIKKKYEIQHIAGEMIPRQTVKAYIQQFGEVVDKVARNTCENCGDEHKIRDELLQGFSLIQSL